MTALDDALGESSVVLGPHQIKALWRESDGASDGSINSDTPTDLSPQFTGRMTINHSLADGLPDPVTATGDADASGILQAEMTGREGLVLSTSGTRTFDAAGGSWDSGAAVTTITAPIPTGALRDDYIFAAVLIDDNTASVLQTTMDPKNQWEIVGFIQDAPLAFWFFAKRRWRTGVPQLELTTDKPVDYMAFSIALWSRNPTDIPMDFKLSHKNMANQGGAGPTLTISGAQLDNKGYFLTFYGAASGNAWTAGAGLTQLGQQSANGLTVMGAISALSDSGTYSWASAQAVANAVAVAGVFALEPFERPRWDGRQYFSPFNTDSPVYGWDRDTAQVTAAMRVLTSDGQTDTAVFEGLMQDIPIQGRSAALNAVSKSRMDMNRSIALPMVSGQRENCTLDWIATYLMARGGAFVGTAPNQYSQYWAPMYGSTHAHWDTPYGYNNAYYINTTTSLARKGRRFPEVVNGKWLTAMYGQQSATEIQEITMQPKHHLYKQTTDDFPHLFENGGTGPLMMDQFSLANSRGKIQFWMRGDAATSAPGYANSADDFLFKVIIPLNQAASIGGGFLGYIELGIASNSRNPYLKMGSDAAGYSSVSFVHTPLPTDGSWNFYGIHWDFAAGSGGANCNGVTITATTWATNGNNVTTGLPSTDAAGRARGDQRGLYLSSHMPISDILLDFGEVYAVGQWNNHYPTPMSPGANSKVWAAHTEISGIAESTAVNAWDTLAQVSRAALASYRCNEADVIEWLTMFHWGEPTQVTPIAVHSTEKDASDMDVAIDPGKIRNVITVQFKDSRIDTNQLPVLLYSAATAISPGLSQITFPLDTPVVEIHGQLNQDSTPGSTWAIANLTAAQITSGPLPLTSHYVTINSATDGTGTVWPSNIVSAVFVAWDANSVTIQFSNLTGATVYLVNNGDQVPFMQILGYGFRTSDAYSTVRDDSSVAIRGVRALETELTWVQNRFAAQEVGLHMANQLSRQRAELVTTVMGDPRRKPGQAVTLLDAQGTMVSGNWRVLSVDHDTDGPAYLQTLKLIEIDAVGVWDASSWDNAVWGA